MGIISIKISNLYLYLDKAEHKHNRENEQYIDNMDAAAEKINCKYISIEENCGIYKYSIVNTKGNCMQKPVKTFFCSRLQDFINSDKSMVILNL